MEDESQGEAVFSSIGVLKVKENPEEADIANVSLALICKETGGKGALDCACTSPAAGENWIKEFIKGLSEEDKKNLTEEKSYKTFKFGGGEVRSSIKCVMLPAEVTGVGDTITTITRSISVRIGQFLSEQSRMQLVCIIGGVKTLVLSKRCDILFHRIFNEGYQCHSDSIPIILTLFYCEPTVLTQI